MRVKRYFNQLTIAVLALGVSLLSVWISLESKFDSDLHARLSVRPYLIITPFLDKTAGKVGLYLSNAGLGPGIIKSMTITIGGKTYEGLGASVWQQVIRDVGGVMGCYRTGWPPSDAVIKSGEDDPLLAVSANTSPSCELDAVKFLGGQRISAHLTYESIYQDKFSFDGDVHLSDANAEGLAWLLKQQPSQAR